MNNSRKIFYALALVTVVIGNITASSRGGEGGPGGYGTQDSFTFFIQCGGKVEDYAKVSGIPQNVWKEYIESGYKGWGKKLQEGGSNSFQTIKALKGYVPWNYKATIATAIISSQCDEQNALQNAIIDTAGVVADRYLYAYENNASMQHQNFLGAGALHLLVNYGFRKVRKVIKDNGFEVGIAGKISLEIVTHPQVVTSVVVWIGRYVFESYTKK